MAQNDNQFNQQQNPNINPNQFNQMGQNMQGNFQNPTQNMSQNMGQNMNMQNPDQFGQYQSPANNNPVVNNGYTPYQGGVTGDIGNFSPTQNFDTGFSNPAPAYSAAQPQYNPNDPSVMPSGSGISYDDEYLQSDAQDTLEEIEEIEEKPADNRKKFLMFGLIGLIVILLVASGVLFFISGNNQPVDVSKTSTLPPVSSLSTQSSTDTAEANPISATPKPIASENKTGSSTTPATKSLVYPDATTLPTTWIKTNFATALNEDGACKTLSVCGENADPDKDGLKNIDEYRFGTNPNLADTDTDGISDKDEVYVYFSNPKVADTDGDTFKDGAELSNCYDPNIAKDPLSKTRLNEISSNINKTWNVSLTEPTLATLKKAGATLDDLDKGYLIKCDVSKPTNSATTNESLATPNLAPISSLTPTNTPPTPVSEERTTTTYSESNTIVESTAPSSPTDTSTTLTVPEVQTQS